MHTFIIYKDTLSHQSGLGVQGAELTSEQSISVDPWRFDRRCFCLFNYSDL